LHEAAVKINATFEEITDNCLLLNTYIPDVKYSNKNQITKQDMDEIIKSLKTVSNFPPIKALRDSFSKKYNYEIVAEIIIEPVCEDTTTEDKA
jgi:hypothetical protein